MERRRDGLAGRLDPQEEKEARDPLGVAGKVLGDHLRRQGQDLVLAEDPDEGGQHGLPELGVVEDRRVRLPVVEGRDPPKAWVMPLTTLSMSWGIFFRLTSLKARTVPSRVTFSAMILERVPPSIFPMVRTAGSVGSTARLITDWSAVMTSAARTMASTPSWGLAPWALRPLIWISNESEPAMMLPVEK